MKNIISAISSLCPLSDATIRALKVAVTPMEFPKRTLLIKAGIYNHYAYFLEEGITRSFWLTGKLETTTSFSVAGGILFSMDELYFGKRSEEYVETLKDCVCYRIGIGDLNELFETNGELCNWGRIIHQIEYRRVHQLHKNQLILSASERYNDFEKQFPEICRNVNLGYIASYLGMTLPTLSRIRSAKCRPCAAK